MIIKGNILNVFTDEVYPAEIKIENGKIESIKEVNKYFKDLIVPGFIDAHIHIESSLLTPSRFAEVALKHGTTSVVADPHEIANVMGMEGIEYMREDAKHSPLNYYFTAPSCVPTTNFETAGGKINAHDIDHLLRRDDFVALGEVMDYPAVIKHEKRIMDKINIAKKYDKPIDGHAPLLSGFDLQDYVKCGITTDHECTSLPEAMEKRRYGMKIMIREGSENHALEALLHSGGDFIVSDDLKAEDLIRGHLDVCLREAVALGMDPFDAIKLVTCNPADHYNINAGAIAPGRKADLVFIDNLEDFNVKRVIINGNTIYKKQKLLYRANPKSVKNTINLKHRNSDDFNVKVLNSKANSATVNVITVSDDTIITGASTAKLNVEKGNVIPSVFEDVLKVSVLDRYGRNSLSNGFIKGFGIKNGAIGSSVSHDSHNVVVVGTNGRYMAEAVNLIHKNKGGLVAVSGNESVDLPLPIAGLMSADAAGSVAQKSEELNEFVQDMGCSLRSPFTTLSFIALPVVPSLKMTNKGLFDVNKQEFIDVIKQ